MYINVCMTSRTTTTTVCRSIQPTLGRWSSSHHALSASPSLSLAHDSACCIYDTRHALALGQTRQQTRGLNCCYKSTPYDLASKHILGRSFASTARNNAMDLKRVVSLLEDFAPTSLAGSWDNVGLLVEPTPPHTVSTVCLTNDLTEEVLDEAIEKQTDLILSYHPPIFVPLKRLRQRNVKERIVVRAVEKRIAIYSPHTACDAVEGGVNDWLVEGLGDTSSNKPLEPCLDVKNGDDFSICVMAPQTDVEATLQKMSGAHNVTCIVTNNSNYQITCSCKKSDLGNILSLVQSRFDVDQASLKITQLTKAPMARTGVGRMATLQAPAPVSTIVKRIKTHLMLEHVQIALGQGKTLESEISTVGICAGSGSSVLNGLKADMFLTGEMSHHDLLAAVAEGTTVVVCNHSNTERGYLHVMQGKLTSMCENKIKVFVSEKDRDPLEVV